MTTDYCRAPPPLRWAPSSNASVGSSGATPCVRLPNRPRHASRSRRWPTRRADRCVDSPACCARRHRCRHGSRSGMSARIFPRRDREPESGRASPHADAIWALDLAGRGIGRAAPCPDALYADGRSASPLPPAARHWLDGRPVFKRQLIAPGKIVSPVSPSARNLRNRTVAGAGDVLLRSGLNCVRGLDEGGADARLHGGVAGVRHHGVFGLRPGPVQIRRRSRSGTPGRSGPGTITAGMWRILPTFFSERSPPAGRCR